MSLHPHPTYHQTPSSAQAKATLPPSSGTEVGNPGGGGSRPSPHGSPRPDAIQRVTWAGPLTVEQDVQDESWIVTVGLTDDAARQLARDLTRRHMADLVLLSRLNLAAASAHRRGLAGTEELNRVEARTVEARLVGALQSMATTQWVLTPQQAEALLDQLEDAQAEPEACAVGTCSANAIDGGSYCAPHDERG